MVCERTFNSFLSGSIHGEVEPDCDNRILKRYFTDCFSGRVEQSVGCMYVCVVSVVQCVHIRMLDVICVITEREKSSYEIQRLVENGKNTLIYLR